MPVAAQFTGVFLSPTTTIDHPNLARLDSAHMALVGGFMVVTTIHFLLTLVLSWFVCATAALVRD